MKKFLLLSLCLATPAFAHARLVSSDPAANAKVKSPGQIKLHFSESLEPAFSTASLIDAKGKTVPVSKSVGSDTITLLPLTLKPGTYKVTWRSVGQDTHALTGGFGFTVIP
ncbi:MAG TPA: copper homeostasis periplasmic binding protein CopC [Rhizomicrobium sp.]|nr:copper homeostasis periplasmic binding protein CopC [Rhizomicrobium sp.]